MTPEEKAEKWVKDKCYSEGTFEVSYGFAGTCANLEEIESEIKQAYLAGYADIDRICNILIDIETDFESVVFDELQRKDADEVLSMLQKIIAEKLNYFIDTVPH